MAENEIAPQYSILSLYDDLLILIFNLLDFISKIRFCQIKNFRFLQSKIAHVDHFNKVHNTIANINEK